MSGTVRPVTDQDTITVVLADDHPVVRSGLRMLLDAEDDLEVVAEAGDVGAARRSVLGYKPTVLVLDLNMPGGSSLEAIPAMAESSPNTSVVVLTMQEDPVFAREALQVGASGYMLKQSAGTELVQAIRAVAGGGTWLNPGLGARIAAAPATQGDSPGPLTDRELDVLRLIALGHTNNEIAGQLYLSVRTVETHRAHIQQKLKISSRAELVRYALDHDLIER
jgi:two-component system response regulator NreC